MQLSKQKLTHLIEFIMNPLYSSVVGFGKTVLKLSSNLSRQLAGTLYMQNSSQYIKVFSNSIYLI